MLRFGQSKATIIAASLLFVAAGVFTYFLKSESDVEFQLSRAEELLSNREEAKKSIKHFTVIATAPFSTVEIHIEGQDSIFVELNGFQADKNERVKGLITKAVSFGITPTWCPDCSSKLLGIPCEIPFHL